jgi:hypothetical protein
MMMLLITACLSTRMETCHAFRVPVQGQFEQFSCMMSSHQHLPQWSEVHPEWKVTRWTCTKVDVLAQGLN